LGITEQDLEKRRNSGEDWSQQKEKKGEVLGKGGKRRGLGVGMLL